MTVGLPTTTTTSVSGPVAPAKYMESSFRRIRMVVFLLLALAFAKFATEEETVVEDLVKGGKNVTLKNQTTPTTEEPQLTTQKESFDFSPAPSSAPVVAVPDGDGTSSMIRWTTYDREGIPLSPDRLPKDASTLTAPLITLLEELVAQTDTEDVAVISLSRNSNSNTEISLEELASTVDEFLTPRMDWRIVVERFEFNTDKNDNDNLLIDPILFLQQDEQEESTMAAATRAWRNILKQQQNENDVDFVLTRVLDDKFSAVARALQNFQFPTSCNNQENWNDYGRTVVRYGGTKDFLGALTHTQSHTFQQSLKVGARFVEATPKWWGRIYQFEDCDKSSGVECAFLPIYGGDCLKSRIDPSMECLSEFHMGSLEMFVLPKDGVPDEVCQQAKSEMPTPSFSDTTFTSDPLEVDRQNRGPPPAFRHWCPNCGFGADTSIPPTVEQITSPTGALSSDALFQALVKKKITIQQYVETRGSPKLDNTMNNSPPCAVPVPPLQCYDRTCCIDEVKIPKKVLYHNGASNAPESEPMIDSASSSFLTRFNRASRTRIARLVLARWKALFQSTTSNNNNSGWRQALATGQCATLHIRRGDNINRCANGDQTFCSMNRTLHDYMHKALPMLEALNHSQHVFVMTDDADQVTDAKLQPWQEQGYVLEVVSGHNQYSDLTYSDWDPFLESLYVAQFCRALVGHHISTVSKLVYRSMCTRWGECPYVDMNP